MKSGKQQGWVLGSNGDLCQQMGIHQKVLSRAVMFLPCVIPLATKEETRLEAWRLSQGYCSDLGEGCGSGGSEEGFSPGCIWKVEQTELISGWVGCAL